MATNARPSRSPLAALGAMFARKTAPAPPPPQKQTATQEDMNSMLQWPWAPVEAAEDPVFGPLERYAQTGTSGDWQLTRTADGLRLNGNTQPGMALTIASALPRGLASLKITAEIGIGHLRPDGGLAGMLVAAHGEGRLFMAMLDDGEIAVFRLGGNGVQMIGQCRPAVHPSGRSDRLTLEALIFEADALLYVNGQYAGTSNDPVLIGQSEAAGFHVKGDADVTLRRFAVETIRPPVRN